MILGLNLIHLAVESQLLPQTHGDVFVLRTCQRTLVVGHNRGPFRYVADPNQALAHYQDEQAYEFLLQTICGLHSRMLGEHEIVGQFKTAYAEFLQLPQKNSHLMFVMEKLFKDAKTIRSKFLHQVGQYSYAGMSRRLLSANTNKGQEVLILGSGALAEDLGKLCSKHFRLRISARNQKTSTQLAEKYAMQVVPWEQSDQWSHYPFIINTIGAKGLGLLSQDFFQKWKAAHNASRHLFIDLGSPSVINTPYQRNDGVVRLEDIFHDVKELNRRKEAKIKAASEAIEKVVGQRLLSTGHHFPFGWEELQFA